MTRLAIIRKDKCHPIKCGEACAKACPVNRLGKDCITFSAERKAIISEELCTGCGICPKKCPFEAISIINLPEQLKEKPIFRYGKNAFELFRLPIPQSNVVVGLLGANGIGKSTALELLCGILKPNLGEIAEHPVDKEIISYFRGTELQSFLTKLFSEQIKVAYKPQYIDQIPEQFKGAVGELLKTKSEYILALGLDKLWDRKIKDLSGGELQKLAIAATISKDAELYLFDEPASYLDIKERIKVAKVIQKLAEKGKSIIVVEHDLVILDYLTDVLHLLYGKTACYGIVSHPLSSKNGINTYLDGYLRDENVRFREQPIKFYGQLTKDSQKGEIFFSWPELKKKLGAFSLESDASELQYKEIVGIVGANGIGKTTFINMLAGLLEPDNVKIEHKLKISYKPQYLRAEKGLTVLDALKSANKNILNQENKLAILQPLGVEHLLTKPVAELSGGELQRVGIAICLAREADLYLLDEPSTYLDVEQRLQAAHTIQKVIKSRDAAALVVDHDLLFISYISDRLLAFDGEPAFHGRASKIQSVKAGMNQFLKELDITLRKDPETGRPRVNKFDSQKDKEQKESGNYYLA